MKFKYLKLTLLMASLAIAPLALQADANTEGAAQLLLELTDISGPKRSLDQTVAVIDQMIGKLQGEPKYDKVCAALTEFKETFIRLNLAQAQGVINKVTDQLEAMHGSLSEDMKNRLHQRKEQLLNMDIKGKGQLLGNLGVTINLATLRKLFGR